MKINTIDELKEKLALNDKCIINYVSTVKLLKKNRKTKEKLVDEYPSLNGVSKISSYEAFYGKSYIDLIKENKADETKEDYELKRESYYDHITTEIMSHKKTGKLYLQIYPESITSIYKVDANDVEVDKIYDNINSFLSNYGPVKKDVKQIKENQNTTVAIMPITLSLDKIQSIEISNIIYYINIQ